MDNFNFYSPTEFVFGKDRENEVGKYVKKFGGSKVLVHFGSGSAVRSGLLDKVKKSLESENIFYTELGGVKPNPRDTLVYACPLVVQFIPRPTILPLKDAGYMVRYVIIVEPAMD